MKKTLSTKALAKEASFWDSLKQSTIKLLNCENSMS